MIRPGVTVCRTIPTVSWTSCATRESGCATTTARSTRAFEHICWDGCMFPNAVMMDPETWRKVLGVMIAVRNAHGWD